MFVLFSVSGFVLNNLLNSTTGLMRQQHTTNSSLYTTVFTGVSHPFFIVEGGDGHGVFVGAGGAAAVQPQGALRL